MPREIDLNKVPFCLCVLIFLLVGFIGYSDETELGEIKGTTPEIYVNDYADILSDEVKNEIISVNKNLIQSNEKIQFIVTTVDGLDGYTSEEYINYHFEKIKSANPEKNTNIVILICKKDRRIRIKAGEGLEECLTQSLCRNILSDNRHYIREKKYSKAAKAFMDRVVYELSRNYSDVSVANNNIYAAEKDKVFFKIKRILNRVETIGIVDRFDDNLDRIWDQKPVACIIFFIIFIISGAGMV